MSKINKKKTVKGLHIKCFKCKKSITKPGGLLFSPPTLILQDEMYDVQKYHICKSCYNRVFDFVRNFVGFTVNSGKIK